MEALTLDKIIVIRRTLDTAYARTQNDDDLAFLSVGLLVACVFEVYPTDFGPQNLMLRVVSSP
jgi:hypothetical protein